MFNSIDIFIYSDSEHVFQIYTGFKILENSKKIVKPHYHIIKNMPHNISYIEVLLDKRIWVAYDLRDGRDIYPSIMVKSVDFYFKRSFYDSLCNNPLYKSRMLPLGLNYYVNIPGSVSSRINSASRLKGVFKHLPAGLKLGRLEDFFLKDFEDLPKISNDPKVLFFARVWPPQEVSIEAKKSFEELNEFRAACIRECRTAFGENFYGGLEYSSYALKNFPDVVVRENEKTKKRRYLKLVKSCDVCIATTGLHDSIGWKMGEYVAASRAIVSESLKFKPTGDFEDGKNFLSFKSVGECIAKIDLLIKDKELRYSIMKNNWNYYNLFLRPDMLVLNTLLKVYEFDLGLRI